MGERAEIYGQATRCAIKISHVRGSSMTASANSTVILAGSYPQPGAPGNMPHRDRGCASFSPLWLAMSLRPR